MVYVETAMYKESIGESTIDFIFVMPLLSKSFFCCKIAEVFDHDLDY